MSRVGKQPGQWAASQRQRGPVREGAKPAPGPSTPGPLGWGLRRRRLNLSCGLQGPARPGARRGSRVATDAQTWAAAACCGVGVGDRTRTPPPRGAQGGAPCSPSHSSGCGGGRRRGMGAKMAAGGVGGSGSGGWGTAPRRAGAVGTRARGAAGRRGAGRRPSDRRGPQVRFCTVMVGPSDATKWRSALRSRG